MDLTQKPGPDLRPFTNTCAIWQISAAHVDYLKLVIIWWCDALSIVAQWVRLLLEINAFTYQGAYRSLKVVFHDFQDLFTCVFQYFPRPFMSIFHVLPGLFNRVDIEQVRFSYNTEYVTQFIIILNNRSNRVRQWTMIMYVKAENVYTGQKCGNHLVYLPWLSRT